MPEHIHRMQPTPGATSIERRQWLLLLGRLLRQCVERIPLTPLLPCDAVL